LAQYTLIIFYIIETHSMPNSIVEMIVKHKRIIPVIVAVVAIGLYMIPVNSFGGLASAERSNYGTVVSGNGNNNGNGGAGGAGGAGGVGGNGGGAVNGGHANGGPANGGNGGGANGGNCNGNINCARVGTPRP
jgi:hypothetical protein